MKESQFFKLNFSLFGSIMQNVLSAGNQGFFYYKYSFCCLLDCSAWGGCITYLPPTSAVSLCQYVLYETDCTAETVGRILPPPSLAKIYISWCVAKFSPPLFTPWYGVRVFTVLSTITNLTGLLLRWVYGI